MLEYSQLRIFAQASTEESEALEFAPMFKGSVLDQEERNRRLYDLLLSKPELAARSEQELMRATYQELRDYN